MKCIQCAKEIEDQARYCPHCGAAQTPAKEEPEKKRPAALLRLAALAGELCLMCSLVSCQGKTYTGIDILRQLAENGTGMWDWEGAFGLLLCAVGAALVLVLSLSRRHWAAVGAAVVSLLSAAGAAALFIYYRLISETITVLYGAYLMLAAYLVMLWAAIARCFHRGRKT